MKKIKKWLEEELFLITEKEKLRSFVGLNNPRKWFLIEVLNKIIELEK